MSTPERDALIAAAVRCGVTLDVPSATKLLALLDELARWNRSYNLTAITVRPEMIVRHLLDSLTVRPWLVGERIIDVGTGAGFPGLPLAIVEPQRRFTLLDSNGKKLRFVAHAVRTLGLDNVETLQQRADAHVPSVPYDTVLTRAFAPLPELVAQVTAMCDARTQVLAMKGKRSAEERALLPVGWRIEQDIDLSIPGLDEARHLLVLRREPPAATVPGSLR